MNKATASGRMAAGLGAIAFGIFAIAWTSGAAFAASVCESLATDPLGVKLIIAGVVLQVCGVLLVRKIVDIQY